MRCVSLGVWLHCFLNGLLLQSNEAHYRRCCKCCIACCRVSEEVKPSSAFKPPPPKGPPPLSLLSKMRESVLSIRSRQSVFGVPSLTTVRSNSHHDHEDASPVPSMQGASAIELERRPKRQHFGAVDTMIVYDDGTEDVLDVITPDLRDIIMTQTPSLGLSMMSTLSSDANMVYDFRQSQQVRVHSPQKQHKRDQHGYFAVPSYCIQATAVYADKFHVRIVARDMECTTRRLLLKEVAGVIEQWIEIEAGRHSTDAVIVIVSEHSDAYHLALYRDEDAARPLPMSLELPLRVAKDTRHDTDPPLPQPIALSSIYQARDVDAGQMNIYWSAPPCTFGEISYCVINDNTARLQMIDALPFCIALSDLPTSFSVSTVTRGGDRKFESEPSATITVGFFDKLTSNVSKVCLSPSSAASQQQEEEEKYAAKQWQSMRVLPVESESHLTAECRDAARLSTEVEALRMQIISAERHLQRERTEGSARIAQLEAENSRLRAGDAGRRDESETASSKEYGLQSPSSSYSLSSEDEKLDEEMEQMMAAMHHMTTTLTTSTKLNVAASSEPSMFRRDTKRKWSEDAMLAYQHELTSELRRQKTVMQSGDVPAVDIIYEESYSESESESETLGMNVDAILSEMGVLGQSIDLDPTLDDE